MNATLAPSHGVPLLELKAVSKQFGRAPALAARIANLAGAGTRGKGVRAVERVDLAIGEGEVIGVVGESGCGKSTLGRLAVGLLPLSAGERYWRGERCAGAERARQLKMQMIFQDPYAALNPHLRVIDTVGEAPVVHGLIGPRQKIEYVGLQLNRVGVDPTLMRRFPHQFSGGQRVRIGIARALAVKPEFVVCDEPGAVLDVSIQAQLLNLLMDLREALDLAYLFLSQDLRVARQISDRVAIMYLGQIVELGPTGEIFANPNHPYTQALLFESGLLEPKQRSLIPVRGEMPPPSARPTGCPFHPRCPYAMPRCEAAPPELTEVAPRRWSACYLNDTPA